MFLGQIVFRPMLWPTLLAVPALAVLIGLGNWQMDRLAWKQGLLARMEAGMSAPARDLPSPATWPDLVPESETYIRVRATGRFDHAAEAHVYLSSLDGEPGYHVITPLIVAADAAVLVDRGFVPLARKAPGTRPQGQVEGPVTVTGILVEPEAANPFTPDADEAANIRYHRSLADIAAARGLDRVFPLLLEADAGQAPGGWPRGGETRLQLRNPHLGYALTWYGLAATLVIVWFAFHVSRGRIGLRR